MHIIDLIVFLVFTGGVMLLGCSFFKKKTSSDEFTSAGRSLPGWVVGMSIFATYVSSISYLGYPGKAFAGDWNAFVFSISIPVASYFAAKYFVPFYRNIGSVSAYSFLEERFGVWARLYASMCYLLTQIARMGAILFLLALPMNSLMGWNIQLVIIVTSIAIIIYSMMGGMKGVIWTEAIQGFILIGGALVCLAVLLFKMPEGPMQTFEIAAQDNKFYLGDLSLDISSSTFWVCLIYGIFINLQNYGIDLNVLNNRLSLNVDYFFEHRTGILLTPNSTPSIIATSLPALNIGEVDNHGYEVALGWNETTARGFNYYVNANVSFARNKIIYMDEVKSEYDYQNQTGGSTGRNTGLYKFERIYQYSDFTSGPNGELILNPALPQPSVTVYPGDAMYADLNNDGVVDGNDKMVAGYSTRPEYIFGLNAGFNYKGFNFSMQWTGASHVSKLMEIEYRIPYTNAGKRGLLQYFYDDCWTPENQSGTLPRAAETSEAWNSENSTLWLRDAKYLRLKTITLGYTFSNSKRLKSIGISSLGISLSGYNLLTFTPLDFIDPESLTNNNGAYPLVKIYSIGLNVNF